MKYFLELKYSPSLNRLLTILQMKCRKLLQFSNSEQNLQYHGPPLCISYCLGGENQFLTTDWSRRDQMWN